MHTIRAKITAITIAAILTAILLVFAACYSTFYRESKRQSVDMMNLLAQDTGKSLETYFESIEQSVEMAGNLAGDTLDSIILVENGAAGSYAGNVERTPEQIEALDTYLTQYVGDIQAAFESVASHTQGVITYYYCISPDISIKEHGFFYSKMGKTGFARQTPLDARELDPADIEHTTWYYTPIKRGRPSWVGPYTAHFLGEMWISSYLVPVYRAGTLIGVLGMDIPVDTLVSSLRSVRVYNSGYACLFDSDGRVLYHPELPAYTIPDQSLLNFSQNLLENKNNGEEVIRYRKDGKMWQLSFVTLSNDMKLVVTAPTNEINASWGHLTRIILLIIVLGIPAVAFLVMAVMKILLRPLQMLTEASRHLEEENYELGLTYKGRDEVGVLTAAFTRMRDRIKSYIDDLNRRVNTDDLTGLPNMRCFFRLAIERYRLLRGEGKHPVMLYFNLIGLQHYNRQFGFEEGDRLIVEIGAILAKHYGWNCVCRFSEDHFCAVTDESNLEAELEAVFSDCRNANNGRSLPLRVGIYPDSLEQVDVNVACDRAKYVCDRQRGSFVSGFYYFDSRMLRHAENVRYIISHLDQAISEHWIQVYYQPIIRAVDGKICDEEALSRWIDPERGMLSPAEFIPILEEARLIYKVDLYVTEQVLEKMQQAIEMGITVVPHSINLSRSDFDACNIVEEITKRVDAAGIARNMITIEITESIIGSDSDFMKEQIRQFQKLGFPVWMDDFGSGYSSLDILQTIPFDLIKFDMSFVKQLDQNENDKIVLTELMKMATAMGVDTICEGVETAEHVAFLREIGCSKLQGYYYCKPIPMSEIVKRYQKGFTIGYENPAESAYYQTIGRVNLFDLNVLSNEDTDALQNYFNTLPMGILEIQGNTVSFIRTNQSYRQFVYRFFDIDINKQKDGYPVLPKGLGEGFMRQLIQCCKTGNRIFFDEQMPDGSIVHSFARRIGINPVTGTTAAAVAVISITAEAEGATYAEIARALAADYYNIYYVDLETEDFIEYTSNIGKEELAVERHGKNFFRQARDDTMTRIYEEDRESFLNGFTKESIIRNLDEQGVFSTTYRLMDTGIPIYVSMKIMRMQPESSHIIIGISIVDTQMKQKQAEDQLRRERLVFRRFAALAGNYLTMYTVDPETGSFREFSSSKDYDKMGIAKSGDDFFRQVRQNARIYVHPDDQEHYLEIFTKENVLSTVREAGTFMIPHRLLINGNVVPVVAKAAMVEEPDGEKLVVGVSVD